MHPAVRPRRWIDRLAMALLLGGFVVGMAVQFHTGLADNGDFTRSIKFFSAGPVGIHPNFPPRQTALWHERFYEYWLPDWTLRHRPEKIITSTVVLWLPGVLLAAARSSPTVSLPWLSLVSRTLLLAEFWLLLRWVDRQPARRLLWLTLGLPVLLLLTTTDNAAYLNSFYQEAGLQVFVLPALCSLVWLRHRPTWPRLGVVVGCTALLAAAKSSTLYWPLLALPFGLYGWTAQAPGRWRFRAPRLLATGLGVACLLTAAARHVTDFREDNVNPYHSLFCGALMFSRQPAEHLRRLGMSDGLDCIGVSAYQDRGKAYFSAHLAQQSFRNTLSTLAHEPGIAWRMGAFGLGVMQDISLDYLGKYTRDDPRCVNHPPWQGIGGGSGRRLWHDDVETTPVNVWSAVKFHVFPTGGWLALTLVTFTGFFGWQLRVAGTSRELALPGMLATLATAADLVVALLGDGCNELIKHLYFANLLFDLALIAFVSGLAVRVRAYVLARAGAGGAVALCFNPPPAPGGDGPSRAVIRARAGRTPRRTRRAASRS